MGSMVVFTDGLPDKAQYRRFKIRHYTGAPDDYAMMREMLERRLGAALAEIAQIRRAAGFDGHRRRQRTVATSPLQAMHDLDIHTPVIGLAKRYEEIFRPGQEHGTMLPRNSRALHLLQRIRDEAHRFALKYHTTLRNRRVKESLLDEIPGIGPSRKQALLKHFGSVDKIRKATPDELAAVPGMNRPLAERLAGLLVEVGES